MTEPAPTMRFKPKEKPPRAPRHLSRSSRAWWCKIMTSWVLDAHHVKILDHAATCLDRAEAARQIVVEKGSIVLDRYGSPKENPACKAERDSMALFARLIRELGLDLGPSPDSRPPMLQSRYEHR